MRKTPLYVWFALAIVAGCGGAAAQDAFNGAGAGAGSDGGSEGSVSPGDDSGGGTGGDAGGLGGKDAGGGGKGDGGGKIDGGGKTDGGNPTADPGIYCGDGPTFCDPASDYCCATIAASTTTYACNPNSVSACAGLHIPCDDRAECPPGNVCCGVFDKNLGYQSIECRTNCFGGSGNTSYVHFCDPDLPVDECAGIGRTCTGASNALPGYRYCQ